VKKNLILICLSGLLLASAPLVCMEKGKDTSWRKKNKKLRNKHKRSQSFGFNRTNSNLDLTLSRLQSLSPKNKFEKTRVVPAKRLVSILRKKQTKNPLFWQTSDTLARALAAATMDFLPMEKEDIDTGLAITTGYKYKGDIILVPILRSGEALLAPFRKAFPPSKVFHILIQRNEETAKPYYLYDKFRKVKNPDTTCIILDPMLATGGSADMAIKKALEHGIQQKNIIFVCVIAAPEGLSRILKGYPYLRHIIVAEIDLKLNDKKFIIPGLGDYGDRYFGTDDYSDHEEEKTLKVNVSKALQVVENLQKMKQDIIDVIGEQVEENPVRFTTNENFNKNSNEEEKEEYGENTDDDEF